MMHFLKKISCNKGVTLQEILCRYLEVAYRKSPGPSSKVV